MLICGEQSIWGRRNSNYGGPEVGVCLEHLRTSKEANVAGAEELSGGQEQEVVRLCREEGSTQGHGLGGHCKDIGLSL